MQKLKIKNKYTQERGTWYNFREDAVLAEVAWSVEKSTNLKCYNAWLPDERGNLWNHFPPNIQKSAHFICKFRSWGVWGKGFANTIHPIFSSTYYDCEHLRAFSPHECPDFTAEDTEGQRNYLMCPRSNSEWYVRICIHTQVHLTCSRCSRHQESLWHAEVSSGLWGPTDPDHTLGSCKT